MAAPTLPKTQDRRWIFQYRLRDLVIGIIVVSVVLAFFVAPSSLGARRTGRELDVAILGREYLQVTDGKVGTPYYTHRGDLSINDEGMLTVGPTADGWILEPAINIPLEWSSLRIDKHGYVAVNDATTDTYDDIGQLELARFANTDGLQEIAPGIFAVRPGSDAPTLGPPGTAGFSFVQQRWLDDSRTWGRLSPTLVMGLLLLAIAILALDTRRLHRRLDNLTDRLHDQV